MKKLTSKGTNNHVHLALAFNKFDNIIEYATNYYHPIKSSVHAEENLLTKIKYNNDKKIKIISLRVLSSGNFAMAKPCYDCTQLLCNCCKVKSVGWSEPGNNIKVVKKNNIGLVKKSSGRLFQLG